MQRFGRSIQSLGLSLLFSTYLSLQAIQSQAVPQKLYLETIKAYRATILKGKKLVPREAFGVLPKGQVSLLFPYKAGVYMAFECTNVGLFGLSNYGGGVQVILQASQRWFCFAQNRVLFKLKRRTNRNTAYNLTVGKTTIRVTGTTGGATSSEGTDYVALSEGSAEVSTQKAKANVGAGQMAVVKEDAIAVVKAPKPTGRAITVNGQVQIDSDLTNRVVIDGIVKRKSSFLFYVRVESLAGEQAEYIPHQWQKGRWELIEKN